MKSFRSLLVCLWGAVIVCVGGSCPTVDPCRCGSTKNGISVECSGPQDTDRILAALGNLAGKRNFEVQLESITSEELPPTIRAASALRMRRCSLARLIGTTPTAWPQLREVVLESVSVRECPWPQLSSARHLRYLKIDALPLPAIGADFRKIPGGVAYLELKRTGTELLEPGSMARLRALVYLHVVDVPLKKFPRSALPDFLPSLHTFILGNTNIDSLEPSFFKGMPKLEVLMLNGNKFSTLEHQLFAPLRSHLTHLLAESNPLVCECSLTWVKKYSQQKVPVKVLATCYDAATQESREVSSLDERNECLEEST